MAKIIYALCVLIAVIGMCSGSAIPMWEFLGRDEKMSHLYSMFAKDVSKYCKSNSDAAAKCKRDMLSFGVTKLEKMSESHLDAMDPFQRSASDIIWDSIMEGHPSMATKKATTTPAPIREAAGLFAHNPLFDGDSDANDNRKSEISNFASEMDFTYTAFPTGPADSVHKELSNQLPQEGAASSVELSYDVPSVASPTTNYLSGPMIVRVRPDGTPVAEDRRRPLPRDDDRDAMTLGKVRMPTLHQLAQHLQAPQPAQRSVYANYRTMNRRHF